MSIEDITDMGTAVRPEPDSKLMELYRMRSMLKRGIETHKNSVFAAMNLGEWHCALNLVSEILALQAKLDLIEGEIYERTGK